MKIELYKLDRQLKNFLLIFVLVMTTGVGTGLAFLYTTTGMSSSGTVTRYNGSEVADSEDEFEIPEHYPKPISELLITTHNHIISMALIFLSVGMIFYFNTVVNGFWKGFLLFEPMVSVVLTFGSIWGMRFLNPSFVYLTMLSGILMYTSYFVIVGILVYELKFKKST